MRGGDRAGVAAHEVVRAARGASGVQLSVVDS
jgi:hypothetical protein